MSNCINRSHPEILQLAEELNVSPAVVAAKAGVWMSKHNIEDRFPTVEELNKLNEVNFALKAIDVLTSDKAIQIFEKGKKSNWDLNKILTELQVPKEQKQLIIDSEKTNLDDIIIDLLANYSYAVEINISKNSYDITGDVESFETENGDKYNTSVEYYDEDGSQFMIFYKNNIKISNKEFKEAIKYRKETQTSYYSNLTVPGGTNYTENEIAIPAISPSIKGHAKFSTDNGIGLFRSDDKGNELTKIKVEDVEKWIITDGEAGSDVSFESKEDAEQHIIDNNFPPDSFVVLMHAPSDLKYKEGSKTRRIIEIQSDLFQKGRDRKSLYSDYAESVGELISVADDINNNKNKFLQLLNKNGNWVTIFVKSIIQDSVKNGYEKVLFPVGDTAARIEGHETVQGFINNKQDRVDGLKLAKITESTEEDVESYYDEFYGEYGKSTYNYYIEYSINSSEYSLPYKTKEDAEKAMQRYDSEIQQLEKEIEDAKAGKLKISSIANFYETAIKNILDKTYGKENINRITDEHGNDWYELELEDSRDKSTIFMKKVDFNNLKGSKKNVLDWYDSEQAPPIIEESIDYSAKNNYVLFGNKQGKITANEILDSIINNSEDLSDLGKEFIQKAGNLVNKSGVKIQFVDEYVFSAEDVVMDYDAGNNTIRISRTRLSKFYTQTVVGAFIHEIAHSQTAKALLNHVTSEEKIFKELIGRMFSKYKESSNGSKSYGFENEMEFVAELYMNPEFRMEIENLDKTLWSRFIDGLRRLFGFKKTSEYDNLIKEIIETVETENLEFRGIRGSIIFAKKEDFKKNRLQTIEQKLNSTLDRVKDNLDQLLKISRTYKKQNEEKGVKFEAHVRELQSEIDAAEKISQWKAVTVYLGSMSKVVSDLNKRIDSEDLTKDNGLELLDSFKNYLSSYGLINDVQQLISELESDKIDEIGREDINELTSVLTQVKGNHSLLEDKFNSKLKKILKTQLNSIHYLPQIEEKWILELNKEYKSKGVVGISRVEWVSRQMNGPRKAEIQVDLDYKIDELLYGIGDDISEKSALLLDGINNNSRLVSIVIKLTTSAREKIIERTLDGDFKDKELFDKFIKEKGNISNQAKLYENLYEFDSEGQGYFKGEYSIEFLNELRKKQDKLDKESDNTFANLNIQFKNLRSLKNNKKTISLRQKGTHSYKEGDTLNVTIKDKQTGVTVEVESITTFENFTKLSDERKDEFAKAIGNYKDFKDLESSNEYLNPDSFLYSTYPELSKFINGKTRLDLIKYSVKNKDSVAYDEYLKNKRELDEWLKENTVFKKKVRTPIAKWKTNYSKLSKTEKEVLDYFIQTTKDTDKETFGINSLIKKAGGVQFYELPAVTKHDKERILEGNLKGFVKDKITDFKTVKPDDIGYEERRLDNNHEVVNSQKVHYRGKIERDQQSLDMFTINRLNRINGINYSEKHKIALQVEAIKQIAKSKDYYQETTGGQQILNAFGTRQKVETKKGVNSNEYKMLKSVVEKNIYDILHVNYGSLGPVDVNKVVDSVNSWTATIGLSLNIFSASANILNAQAQMFLEKVAGNHITSGSIKEAHKVYTDNFVETVKDYNSPVKTSLVNQINQMFDTFGGFTVKQQEFLKNTIAKTAIDMESLQFMHQGGEHYAQSIITMASLASVKVMNENNEFIDKDGKVVTEDKAANLLQMLAKDNTGRLRMSDKVVFTTRSSTTRMDEGGKHQIMLFVKKKIFDTMGNYDSNFQNEFYRHWYGKLFGLFRRYLIPSLVARYRGASSFWVREEDLTEDQIHFNDALRASEEGSYVSLLRFLVTAGRDLKGLKFEILSSNWNELSDDKKAGIKKAITEIAITSTLLPLLGMLAAGAAGDDDDSWYWTIAYLARRLESELSQFRDPREAYKITKSPIPSLRVIELALTTLEHILPWNWAEIDDRFESGKHKGGLKIMSTVSKATGFNKFDNTSKELHDYMDSTWGK